MKLRHLFLASVACAGLFAACSNGIDEVIDNGNNETNNGEKAYASFAYALPAGSSSTRANDPGTEVGTDEENKVVDIAFVLFNADGIHAKTEVLTRDKFNPTVGSPTTFQTISPIQINTGEQRVYVIVNPSATIKNYKGTENEFKTLAEKNYKNGKNEGEGDGFTMSNASIAETYTINPQAKNTISDPVKLTVPVERMAARIDYTVTKKDNKYEVVSAAGDYVTVQDYRIVNTRTNAFLLKRVGTTVIDAIIGAPETSTSYVIDPFFTEKSNPNFFTTPDGDYGTAYSNKLADTPKYVELPTTATSRLAYCHENTMEANVQKTGGATGLVLQAQYVPEGMTSGADFYRYNSTLYPSLLVMYEKLNPEWAKNKTDRNLIRVDVLNFKNAAKDKNFEAFIGEFKEYADLKPFYVDLYKNGICYYTTYLRHINNGDNQSMGIMEYAIVRNNIYKLSINSINKLGDPTAPVDPDKPIEEKNTYLNVTVNVLDWTTRDNAVDL